MGIYGWKDLFSSLIRTILLAISLLFTSINLFVHAGCHFRTVYRLYALVISPQKISDVILLASEPTCFLFCICLRDCISWTFCYDISLMDAYRDWGAILSWLLWHVCEPPLHPNTYKFNCLESDICWWAHKPTSGYIGVQAGNRKIVIKPGFKWSMKKMQVWPFFPFSVFHKI